MNNPQMKHWNGNVMAAIDTETTGLNPDRDEIIQFSLIAVGSNLKRNPHYEAIDVFLTPEHPIEFYRGNPDIKVAMPSIEKAIRYGIPPVQAAGLLNLWYERHKECGLRGIIPLAHNWPFDSMFIRRWLGHKNFEYIFSPLYRDPLSITCFLNDIACIQAQPYPFPKHDLSYLGSQCGFERFTTHDSFEDCKLTLAVFERAVREYSGLWAGPVKNYYDVDSHVGQKPIETFGSGGPRTDGETVKGA